MSAWVAIAVGGALGSVARHGVNRSVHQLWPLVRFPLSTVIVNLVGCAAIGLLAGLIASGRLPMRAEWREFVFVGVLGGFTTFSTFGLDTVTLMRTGDPAGAFLNVVLQVVGGISVAYIVLAVVVRFGALPR
jgi:CrcB protein